ncbi:hypothetical protein FJTKL_14133 [Diaporthe vaccinii]|uniref:Protein kinase domain-containing protein n=1 Tax=Diaporthe vaccinii TaxID=105482 RepID=A0ABR4E8M6_9PEZI
MQENRAESPPRLSARYHYQEHLQRIQRRNFEGKVFYHQPHVTSWMLEKAANTGFSNAERLVMEVYAHDRDTFPPRLGENLLVFSVLLHEEIQCGHMVHIFQRELPMSYHLQLEDLSKAYERILHDLETSHPQLPSKTGLSNYIEVIQTFEKLRWSFVPVQLHLNMNYTISHASAVLPFCYREVINDKGGTASVCLHGIQQDLVEDSALRKALEPSRNLNKEYGICYNLAVKSYMEPMKSIYEIESQAFQGIRDQQGVVQYLGEYRLQHPTIHYPSSPSHHIMLEYGEMDLDEYLAETFPPVLNEEISEFWKELFSIARTLKRIHHLQYDSSSASGQHYRGWHGDIKPDNILRVRGKYKLADFGFAKFERERNGNTKTFLLGGTRTYGAPECDLSRNVTRTPLSQTIDTWSFGCVLSSVATWVVLGSQAYENYNERRRIAIRALKNRQAKDARTSVPSCEDTFHDGKMVLPAVTEWHVYLRNSARRADTTTYRVLDLVEGHMLVPNPEKRMMMGELCERLDKIIWLSGVEYQQNLGNGTLRTIGQETLNALQELENQSHFEAVTSQRTLVEAGMEGSDGYGGRSETEAPDDKFERDNRSRKSERFEKILLAKVANRVQTFQALLGISGSPTHLPLGSHPGSGLPVPRERQQQEKTPDIRSDIINYPSVEGSSSMPPPQEKTLDVQRYTTARPEGLSLGFSGTESSRQLQGPDRDPRALEDRQEDVQISFKAAKESFEEKRHGTFEDPESAAAGARASTFGRSDMCTFTHDLPAEKASSNGQISGYKGNGQPTLFEVGGDEPALSTTAISHELAAQHRNWDGQKKSWRIIKGVPQDQRLKRFISNRDVVFVVDNAYSMLPHWENLKTTLLALAMKIGSLDKDGLDLVYTCGDTNNVNGAKGWEIPKAFEQSIDRARSIMDQQDKTNIEETLSKCFDSHSATNLGQRQTLIVLTNGLWEGSKDCDSAETEIARYVDALRKNLKKREKRWFTIQFIAFGQDQKALKRLQELDDNLHGPDGKIVEDIVDTKPWYFEDVESLILGSVHGAADLKKAADGDETYKNPPPTATARNPSPAASLTAGTNFGRKASNRVSRFLGRDP